MSQLTNHARLLETSMIKHSSHRHDFRYFCFFSEKPSQAQKKIGSGLKRKKIKVGSQKQTEIDETPIEIFSLLD